MRGSPALQVLLLAVLIALTAIPVASLTWQNESARPVALPLAPVASRPVVLRLSSTTPGRVIVARNGKDILNGSPPASEVIVDLPAEQTTDLVVSVIWENDSLHALRAEARSDDETLAEISLWGTRGASGVLTIPAR